MQDEARFYKESERKDCKITITTEDLRSPQRISNIIEKIRNEKVNRLIFQDKDPSLDVLISSKNALPSKVSSNEEASYPKECIENLKKAIQSLTKTSPKGDFGAPSSNLSSHKEDLQASRPIFSIEFHPEFLNHSRNFEVAQAIVSRLDWLQIDVSLGKKNSIFSESDWLPTEVSLVKKNSSSSGGRETADNFTKLLMTSSNLSISLQFNMQLQIQTSNNLLSVCDWVLKIIQDSPKLKTIRFTAVLEEKKLDALIDVVISKSELTELTLYNQKITKDLFRKLLSFIHVKLDLKLWLFTLDIGAEEIVELLPLIKSNRFGGLKIADDKVAQELLRGVIDFYEETIDFCEPFRLESLFDRKDLRVLEDLCRRNKVLTLMRKNAHVSEIQGVLDPQIESHTSSFRVNTPSVIRIIDFSNFVYSEKYSDIVQSYLRNNIDLVGIKIGNNNYYNNDYDASGTRSLLTALQGLKTIYRLILTRLTLSLEMMEAINVLLTNQQLHFLDISDNQLDNSCLSSLGQAIASNQSLITLDLSENRFDVQALIGFVKVIRNNHSLRSLHYTVYANEAEAEDLLAAFDEQLKKGARKRKSTSNSSRQNSLIEVSLPENKERQASKRSTNDWHSPQSTQPKPYKKAIKDKYERFIQDNKTLQQLLIQAARSGDLEEFKNALNKGASLYAEDQGEYLLHIVVRCGHDQLVHHLLTLNIQRELRNAEGKTALSLANEVGHAKIVQLLSTTTPQSTTSVSTSVTKKPKKHHYSSSTPSGSMGGSNLAFTPAIIATAQPTTGQLGSPSSTSQTVSTGGARSLRNIPQPISLFDRNEQQESREMQLHSYVVSLQRNGVEMLLNSGVSVDALDEAGCTALDRLILRINERENDHERLHQQLQMLHYLIEQGADVNHRFCDVGADKAEEFTPLLKAVRLGHYRTIKLLTKTDPCDLNAEMSSGNSALLLAVLGKYLRIFKYLIMDPRISKSQLEGAESFLKKFIAENDLNTLEKEMLSLLELRKNMVLPEPSSGIQWVSDLQIVYRSNKQPEQPVIVSAHRQHAYLHAQNKFTQFKLSADDHDERLGNPVTASLCFILSKKSYLHGNAHTKTKIWLNLDFVKNFHITEEIDDKTMQTDRVPREWLALHMQHGLKDNYINYRGNRYHPKQAEQLSDYDDNTLAQFFHHGEYALIKFLEQESVAKELSIRLKQHPKFVVGSKIYAVILDIASPRYVCEDCEVGLLALQNPKFSPFLRNIQLALSEECRCHFPLFSSLRFITRVSSYLPFHSEHVTEEEHQMLFVDIKASRNQWILAQDITSLQTRLTQFHSSAQLLETSTS